MDGNEGSDISLEPTGVARKKGERVMAKQGWVVLHSILLDLQLINAMAGENEKM